MLKRVNYNVFVFFAAVVCGEKEKAFKGISCLCLWLTAEELNVVGAPSTSADNEGDPEFAWSPGALKYYGRAELKTSDHR